MFAISRVIPLHFAACLAFAGPGWASDYVVAFAPAADQAAAQAAIDAVRDWWLSPQEVKGGDTLRIYGTANQTLSKPIEAEKVGGWLSGWADSREQALEGLADDMKAALVGPIAPGSAPGDYASPASCLAYLTTHLAKAPAGIVIVGTPLNRDPRDPRNDQLADNRYRWPTSALSGANFAQGSLCVGGLPRWAGGEVRLACTAGRLAGASVPRDLVERQAWLVQGWCAAVGARSLGFETTARAALSAVSGNAAAPAAVRDLPCPESASMVEETWPVADLVAPPTSGTQPGPVSVVHKIELGKESFAANAQGSEYEVHDYQAAGTASASITLAYDLFSVPDSLRVTDLQDGSVIGAVPLTSGQGRVTFTLRRPTARFRVQVNEPGAIRGSAWTYALTAQ